MNIDVVNGGLIVLKFVEFRFLFAPIEVIPPVVAKGFQECLICAEFPFGFFGYIDPTGVCNPAVQVVEYGLVDVDVKRLFSWQLMCCYYD